MAESKKRYPGQDLYKALHKFFNQEARDYPGNRYPFEDVMTEVGYKFVHEDPKNPYVLLPDGSKSFSSRHTYQVRFSEVIEDMDRRLKAHGYTWSVKEGQRKGTKYGYAEPIPYDLPEECDQDCMLDHIELLKEIVGYTRTSFSSKEVKKDIISIASIGLLNDIDRVKEIFLAIRDSKVVAFTYHAANSNHPKHFTLSPHYLKQYNQRWFLFGYVEEVSDDDDPSLNADSHPREGYYTFAVDRMDDDFILRTDMKYHQPQSIDYSTYFNDIVGVTHFTDRSMEPVDITITTYSRYIHNLLMANPIHLSQKEVTPCVSKKEPGSIRLHVCVNQELERILLGYGENIKVEWNGPSYDSFVKRIDAMNKHYKA
jgi:hypothetical protein